MLSLLVLLLPNLALLSFSLFTQNAKQSTFTLDDDVKVPVQLGVMSRCPDALICENIFDQVLKKVADKIDLSLIYIAEIDSSAELGVACKHGTEECVGNIHQLCVQKYATPAHWWEFIHCSNYEGKNKIGLPETAFKCAKAAQIDWEGSGVGSCAGADASGHEEEGINLLKENVLLGKQMGLKTSCTVVINGEEVCVHDETWKQCENGHTVNDFVRQINDEYNRLNA
ncbi:hypothetical protein VNI00_005573 [Paramarasmius palmivorus]|uniref:Uncharacterized protein n=1 Tax=Paramarasmius palmivorus TaxID=297713 RepID=A0AAW0DEL7_9AGAR